jgi:chromosome condensin MukBEF ATPase and DNA-binding subunit MukB
MSEGSQALDVAAADLATRTRELEAVSSERRELERKLRAQTVADQQQRMRLEQQVKQFSEQVQVLNREKRAVEIALTETKVRTRVSSVVDSVFLI